MSYRLHLVIALVLLLCLDAKTQPLTNPYTFSMGPELDLDTSLVVGPWDGSEPDRIRVKDGHFVHEDGSPFRMVGTTVQYGACFPDSATAIAVADRFRALGINTVRFGSFDYTRWWRISILADGPTTTGNGLQPEQMARMDWFTYQLRQRGIRYGFSFQSAWYPREADGVRQPDSTGAGARMAVIFDPVIQRIHRDVMRLLLTHVNPHTGKAYKDDPALAFVMPLEDSPLTAYWMYTKEINADNIYGSSRLLGLEHQRWMDSTFYAYLRSKGLTTDAALKSAWSMVPSDPSEQIRNGSFEDPFEPSWALNVGTNNGAQALFQFTETDKVSGAQCARIRIGKLASPPTNGSINLVQTLTKVERLHRYRLTLHARTSATKATRTARLILYLSVYPYAGAGLDKELELTSTWKKFEYDFTASSLESGSIAMQIQCGLDTGDIYIDDVSFKEIGANGLKPGESLTGGTLQRALFFDPMITSKRMQTTAEFYLSALTNLLESDRHMIRDTLKSDVLLVPSNRSFMRLDQQAAINYDFFASTEWRSAKVSPLDEMYGASIFNHVQVDYDTKPFVLTHTSIQYPLPYQHELAIVNPTYAGLHNWDGVFFSVFADVAAVGREKVDSLSWWNIFDKPNVLTQLPAVSNMLRRYDIAPSTKVLQVGQNQEALSYPPFHYVYPFSLSVYSDSRMSLFRRTEVLTELQEDESITPHREISALSGTTVDPTMLNAENEQIFFDATKGILRTITPNYINVAGQLAGQIVNEGNIIVEQVNEGEHTSVVLSTLTDKPILESPKSLLVIGGRGLNNGTTFATDLSIDQWGAGPLQMEGKEMRITLRMPTYDSCRVVPLGPDARPLSRGEVLTRSQTGRFSIQLNTAELKSPWYRLYFSNTGTSVAEAPMLQCVISPNPAEREITVQSDGAFTLRILDIMGVQHADVDARDRVDVSVSGLPSGMYVVEVSNERATKTTPLIIQR